MTLGTQRMWPVGSYRGCLLLHYTWSYFFILGVSSLLASCFVFFPLDCWVLTLFVTTTCHGRQQYELGKSIVTIFLWSNLFGFDWIILWIDSCLHWLSKIDMMWKKIVKTITQKQKHIYKMLSWQEKKIYIDGKCYMCIIFFIVNLSVLFTHLILFILSKRHP